MRQAGGPRATHLDENNYLLSAMPPIQLRLPCHNHFRFRNYRDQRVTHAPAEVCGGGSPQLLVLLLFAIHRLLILWAAESSDISSFVADNNNSGPKWQVISTKDTWRGRGVTVTAATTKAE